MRWRTNSIRRAYPYQFQSPHIHFLRNGFNFSNDVTEILQLEKQQLGLAVLLYSLSCNNKSEKPTGPFMPCVAEIPEVKWDPK